MFDPGPSWGRLFTDMAAQGDTFDTPLSRSNWYYAFLSTCEQDEISGKYDLMFEVVPSEWMENVYFRTPTVRATAPTGPASCYQLVDQDEATILQALGLKSADYLAEGSWYLLRLEKGSGAISGSLYDPDIDMAGNER